MPPGQLRVTGSTTKTRVAASYGKACGLNKGSSIVLTNISGNQVVDTWAFCAEDISEYMCMAHTRSVNSAIYPKVGSAFVTNRRRPILSLIEDTSPGLHDTVLCACNRAIYEELGCTDYHRNCEDNLHEALAEIGLTSPFTPAPLNLFMNTPVVEGGAIDRRAPQSRPGDHVVLRAEIDSIVVVSACPQDITLINGDDRQPQDIEFQIV